MVKTFHKYENFVYFEEEVNVPNEDAHEFHHSASSDNHVEKTQNPGKVLCLHLDTKKETNTGIWTQTQFNTHLRTLYSTLL